MHSRICWTVRHLSNLWCCIFWHLGSATFNFITAEGRFLQLTTFSQQQYWIFSTIWIFFNVSAPVLKQILKQSLWLQRSFYLIVFKKTSIGWFVTRRENISSLPALRCRGIFLCIQIWCNWLTRLASVQPLVSFCVLDWLHWACTWARFQKNLDKNTGLFFFFLVKSSSNIDFFLYLNFFFSFLFILRAHPVSFLKFHRKTAKFSTS